MRLITLTTDFALKDWFVGTLKGVIARIAPRAQVVDITHDIAPGDIWGGAFALAAAEPFFPAGTVHVVVVDPGVGSSRPAIVVRTNRALFVGPDNGVLSLALRGQMILAVHRIENPSLCLPEVSRTFHGRDVFAAVAAHLAKGVSLRSVGPCVKAFVKLRWPEPKAVIQGWQGEVVFLDRFGNAITNLPASLVRSRPPNQLRVKVGQARLPVGDCYAAVARGRPLAVVGSTGLLEIAVNGGSAAARLRLRRGRAVRLIAKPA